MSTAVTSKPRVSLPLGLQITEKQCNEVYHVNYQKAADLAAAFVKKHGVKPAAQDTFRVCVIPIDMQIDFCQSAGSLYVQNAESDTKRICDWILRNLGVISKIKPTMDTHKAYQIFHPAFFVDAQGNHPAPMTMISTADVKSGKWSIAPNVPFAATGKGGNYNALQAHLLHYVTKLEAAGRYQLCVWPYHTMLGGIGHSLVPAFAETCFFHAIARGVETDFEIKGGNPLTENYSPFEPEVLDTAGGRPIAQQNVKILDEVLNHDAVFICGQAKSHCVAWGIDSILSKIQAKDPSLAKKIWLLEDCTSPVIVPGIVDFTAQANAAFDRFKAAGMNVVQSTDAVESYLPL